MHLIDNVLDQLILSSLHALSSKIEALVTYAYVLTLANEIEDDA